MSKGKFIESGKSLSMFPQNYPSDNCKEIPCVFLLLLLRMLDRFCELFECLEKCIITVAS